MPNRLHSNQPNAIKAHSRHTERNGLQLGADRCAPTSSPGRPAKIRKRSR